MMSDSTEVTMYECPCCGEKTLPKQFQPSENIKEAYMASLLAGSMFTYTYDLYKGTVHITVTEPPEKQKNKVLDLLTAVLNKLGNDLAIVQRLRYKLIRVLYITGIKIKNSKIEKYYDYTKLVDHALEILSGKELTVDIVSQLCDYLSDLANLSSIATPVVDRVADTHIRIASELKNDGFDKDFYQGIEGV